MRYRRPQANHIYTITNDPEKKLSQKRFRTGSDEIEDFTRRLEMSAIVRPCHTNPLGGDAMNDGKMDHWSITLEYREGPTRKLSSLSTFFSTGACLDSQYRGDSNLYKFASPPTPGCVLEALVGDIVNLTSYNYGFEGIIDLAESYAIDEDEALALLKYVVKLRHDMKQFLGEHYDNAILAYRTSEGMLDDGEEPYRKEF